jgi:type IV secretory pathway VirB10-like protein
MEKDKITLRARPVKGGMSIKRSAVYLALLALAALISYAVAFGLSDRKKRTEPVATKNAQPSDEVRRLPSSYSDIRSLMPSPPFLSKKGHDSDESQKILAKMRADALTRKSAAQIADVEFSNSRLPVETSRTTRDSFESQKSLALLSSLQEESSTLPNTLTPPPSPYLLTSGTVIPGVLLTGINSDLPGQVLGQLTQNIFDSKTGHYLLIPQGTKLVGQYQSQIVYGQERVLVGWNRLIFPDTSSLSLGEMPGVDQIGNAGLTDLVNNHYGKLFTGIVLTSLLGATAQMAEGPSYRTQDPHYSQLAAQGVARTANEVGQEITRRNLNVQPTLEIRPGHRFSVFVTKDIVLSPFIGTE